MTLLELCEPLFQYVCRLNRSPRKGGTQELNRVRSEVVAVFGDMKSKASSDPQLLSQCEKVELPLIFFVDFMIKESGLSFARDWRELAHERDELAGDEAFFQHLEETLADSSEAAKERLAVFYTCIGLGFTGWYTGQPEHLRKKMLEISARIRGMMNVEELSRICPEAYEHTDTRDLTEPIGAKLVGMIVALIGLGIVLFVTNIYLYMRASKDLDTALDKIRGYGQYEAAAVNSEEPSGDERPTEGSE